MAYHPEIEYITEQELGQLLKHKGVAIAKKIGLTWPIPFLHGLKTLFIAERNPLAHVQAPLWLIGNPHLHPHP